MSNDATRNKLRRQAEKFRAAGQKKTAREIDSYLRQLEREDAKRVADTIKFAKKYGIYNPKGTDLTRYRKSRINKVAREFGDFFDPKKFTFVKPEKKVRARVNERATGLDLKTTKTGFFVAKEGHTKAVLKHDRKRDEYYVERSGKVKYGERKGKRYRTIMPLASLDEIEKQENRLRDMAAKLGPIGKNSRLAFEIIEQGNEGFSHATFTDMDKLIAYLGNYRKTISARVQFLRHIRIVKTDVIGGKVKWYEDHPVKGPKNWGRRIHTKTDYERRKGR